MSGEIVADKLAFPEGPVWHNGVLYFVEIAGGTLRRYVPGVGVEPFAQTRGGPNGATLGPDGVLWVTQNGGMQRENSTTPGIQAIAADGQVRLVTDQVAGVTLDAPNDLAFGPDGRLYFTDPRGVPVAEKNTRQGRIFAWDWQRGTGELVREVGPVFPNGIAFDRDGTLIWTESFTRRVMALRPGAREPEVLIELPERHHPDGFCLDSESRLYIGSTYAHCVTVVEAGRIVERYMCGDGMPTNCCFGGTDLYVTESRRGTLWRFAVGVTGMPLHAGT